MKLNYANACCRSVHNILSASVLPTNINIWTYITVFPVFNMGVKVDL